MSAARTFLKSPVAPVLAIVISLALIGAVWVQRQSPDTQQSRSAPPTVLQGSERVASHTPEDWVGVADAVAVVSVADERRVEPAKSETATGDGTDLVGRSVTLTIKDVLWRADGSPNPPGDAIELDAVGWMVSKDSTREAVFAGTPRLEVGHTYVAALVWMRPECSEGDKPSPAGWAIIGSGGTLPADDMVIGQGEYQGSKAERSEFDSIPKNSVLARALDRSPSEVADLLKETQPQPRVDFQEGAQKC